MHHNVAWMEPPVSDLGRLHPHCSPFDTHPFADYSPDASTNVDTGVSTLPFFHKNATSQVITEPADLALPELLARLHCLDSFDFAPSSSSSASSLCCSSTSVPPSSASLVDTLMPHPPFAPDNATKPAGKQHPRGLSSSFSCLPSLAHASNSDLEASPLGGNDPWLVRNNLFHLDAFSVSAEQLPRSPSPPSLPPPSLSSSALTAAAAFDEPSYWRKPFALNDTFPQVEAWYKNNHAETSAAARHGSFRALHARGLVAPTLEAWDDIDYYPSYPASMLQNGLSSRTKPSPSLAQLSPNAALHSNLHHPRSSSLGTDFFVSSSEQELPLSAASLSSFHCDPTVHCTEARKDAPQGTSDNSKRFNVTPTNKGNSLGAAHPVPDKSQRHRLSDDASALLYSDNLQPYLHHRYSLNTGHQEQCTCIVLPLPGSTHDGPADRAPSLPYTAASASTSSLSSSNQEHSMTHHGLSSNALDPNDPGGLGDFFNPTAQTPRKLQHPAVEWLPLEVTLNAPETLQKAHFIFQVPEARQQRRPHEPLAPTKSRSALSPDEDSLSSSLPSGLPNDSPTQTEQQQRSLTRTPASLGVHPVSCKPCAFYWTKGCVNGDACQFCHQQHTPKKKKPMKDQKNLMIIARPDGRMEYLRCTVEEALKRS